VVGGERDPYIGEADLVTGKLKKSAGRDRARAPWQPFPANRDRPDVENVVGRKADGEQGRWRVRRRDSRKPLMLGEFEFVLVGEGRGADHL